MNILDLAIKSILAGTVGWTAICMLRRSSASTRHAALILTLIGVCLLPAVSMFIPQWHVPFIKMSAGAPAAASAALSNFAAVHGALITHSPQPVELNPIAILLGLWAAVAAFLFMRVVARLLGLGRAERKLTMNVDPGLQALVAERCHESGRHVLLLEGLENEPPMTWGHYRPVLVLPADARSWPEDRLNSVVLHELAHIERGDWLASIFAQLACSAYWFNPFVWAIKKRMETESETAADDRVLSLGVSAAQYASHLVDVSKELHIGRSSTHVALAMARPGKLDRRIRAILEARRCRRTVRGGVTLLLAATVAGLVGVVAAAAPTVVREVTTPPEVTISSQKINHDLVENSDTNIENISVGSVFAGSREEDDSTAGAGNLKTGSCDHRMVPKSSKSVDKPNPRSMGRSQTSSRVVSTQIVPPANGVSRSTINTKTPKSPDLEIDMSDLAEKMKSAGAEIEAATKDATDEVDKSERDALADIAKAHLTDKGFIEGLTRITTAASKMAVQSANKATKAQIEAVFKSLKSLPAVKQPPPVKHKT